MKKIICGIFIGFLMAACNPFEYHPYDTHVEKKYKDTNRKNLERIQAKDPHADTVRFIFMGDTHRWYDETEAFVKAVNRRKDIDFVVHGGDISDFGAKKGFCWIHDIMRGLDVPYVAIVGNHDLLGSGGEIFRSMYGEFNFSFLYGGIKFVCLNTNALDFDYAISVPDFEFLRKEIADTVRADWRQSIVLMHTEPGNLIFNNNVKDIFHEELKRLRNLRFCVHAHEHHLMKNDFFDDGIIYYGSDAMKNRNYLLFTVTEQDYRYEVVCF